MQVHLREVIDTDLELFFAHQSDAEAARIAGVTPRDHATFFTHWSKVRALATNITRTIEVDGAVAGNIGSWLEGDQRLVGYWVDRPFWNRGVATKAIQRFIAELPRPLIADVTPGNVGSWKALERAGFTRISESDDTFTYELR